MLPVIFLLFIINAVSGISTVGTVFPRQYIVGGQVFTNSTVTIKCDASHGDYATTTNISVSKTSGGTAIVSITCNPPTITFDVTYKGVVPVDGKLISRQACIQRDNDVIVPGYSASYANRSIFVQASSPYAGASFTSQAVTFPIQSYHMMYTDPAFHSHMAQHVGEDRLVHRKLPNGEKFLDLVVGAIAIGLASAALAAVEGLKKGMDAANAKIDNLQQDAVDTAKNLTNFANKLNAFESNVTATITKISGSLNTVQDVLNSNQQSTIALSNQVNAQAAAQGLVNKALSTTVNAAMNNISALGTQLQALTALTSAQNLATMSIENRTIAQLVNLTAVMNANFLSLSNTTNNNYQLLNNKIRATTQSIRDLSQVVNELYMNTPIRRSLTRAVMLAILNLTNSGTSVPFLSNLGVLPAADISPYIVLPIATLRVMFMDPTRTLYQMDTSIYCYIESIFSRPKAWNTWNDFFEQLGPSNCTVNDITKCYCFANTTIQYCAAAVGVTPSTLLSSTSIAQSMCAVSLGFIGPTFITDPNVLLANLSFICNKGTYAGSQYAVAEIRTNQLALSDYDPTICSMNLLNIFAGGGGTNTVNFAYAFFNLIDSAFAVAYAGIEGIMYHIDGVMASNITYNYQPFEFVLGQTAMCTQANFMSYTADPANPGHILTAPVYLLNNPRVVTKATISVDGVAYSDYDTTASQQIGYDLLSEYVLIGNPMVNNGGYVYDVSPSDTPISAFASARAGHCTYVMLDSPTDFSITAWEAKYGALFDHTVADNVVSAYKRQVMTGGTNQGQLCNITTGTVEGTVCTIMKYLYFASFNDPLIINTNPTATLAYKTGSYTVEVPVPDGTVSIIENTGCPTVNVQTTNTKGATVQLINPTNTTFYVSLVFTGGCPFQENNIEVPGGGSFPYQVPTCSVHNTGLNVTVYQSAGDTQLGKACGKPFDVTTNRSGILLEQGMADLGYVDSSSFVTADTTGASISALFAHVTNIMNEMNLADAQQATILSAQIIIPDLSVYQNISKSLTDLYKNVSTTVDTIRSVTPVNLTQITSPYDGYIQQQKDIVNKTLSASSDQLVTLNGQLADVNQSVQATIIAMQESINATNEFVISLNRTLNDIPGTIRAITDALSQPGPWDEMQKVMSQAAGVTSKAITTAAEGAKQFADAVKSIVFSPFNDLLNKLTGILPGMVRDGLAIGGFICGIIAILYVLYIEFILCSATRRPRKTKDKQEYNRVDTHDKDPDGGEGATETDNLNTDRREPKRTGSKAKKSFLFRNLK